MNSIIEHERLHQWDVGTALTEHLPRALAVGRGGAGAGGQEAPAAPGGDAGALLGRVGCSLEPLKGGLWLGKSWWKICESRAVPTLTEGLAESPERAWTLGPAPWRQN